MSGKLQHRCRIDAHAHLYDIFSARIWCESAIANLGGSSPVEKVVIVVDRDGQNSLQRLCREVPLFGTIEATWQGRALQINCAAGQLIVVPGVQYVSEERIEVLGLGVERGASDRLRAAAYIELINQRGGIACLPWSPGKWLGRRGAVVKRALDGSTHDKLSFGDIAIRTRLGPPSLLLHRARAAGFAVINGTDPLPHLRDQSLVGSFGLELAVSVSPLQSWQELKCALLDPSKHHAWGAKNSILRAVKRFMIN